MKTAMKSMLLIVFVGIMLIVSLNIALARFARGGDDTYYDIVRTCTDGIEIGLAVLNEPTSSPTLDGNLLLDGSTVLNSTNLPLTNDPISIPGVPGTLQWSGYTTANWTKTLQPGSRIELHLQVPNTTVVDKIFTAVGNCSVTGASPTTESNLFSKLTDSGEVIPANDMLTSILPVSMIKPIGDVNVAMHVRAGTTQSSISALQASLTSPEGTTVTLFDSVTDPSAYYLGSYCFYTSDGSNTSKSLFGDVKADFILDDDSVFEFNNSDPAVKHPFINTTVAPKDALSSFLGENATGDWELVINNQSVEGGLLICWYLEIEDAACHALTLTHAGDGSDPTASPANSTGCTTGEYTVGESINVTAFPAAGHHVGDWNGTTNDASTASSNEVSMPDSSHTVTANYVQDAPTCYALTRSYTGTGSQPTASPANSTGCTTGEYIAGASINVTAFPAAGHHVGSWNGTIDDTSTASSNVVSMPASPHTATANYDQDAPTCYALTRSYTGTGSQPTALPANSTGCTTGEYIAGASINVTAFPAAGHHVGGWNGTIDDTNTASNNEVSMPASPHTVIANYDQDAPTCYALTRSYTGTGSQPTASPANSTGCTTGQYVAGASINVTAFPAAGHHVGSWNGTNNDASTASSNVVSMPTGPHTITANYIQDATTCYALTRNYTGTGSQPTASPANSTGCTTGEYVAGASINVTAFPATGHHVGGWNGTIDDISTANSNEVSMPAGPHTATANYVQDPGGFVYLPTVLNKTSGRLAFVSNRHDGNEEIYLVDTTGANTLRLTNNPAFDWGPSWSTDGKRIVFSSDRDGDMELYVMDGNGSNVTQLTHNDTFDCCAEWSPDNTRLVFNATNGDPLIPSQNIFVMNADGSGITNLTNSLEEDWEPTWSPDGKKIAFQSSRSGQWDIYAMNADGSGLQNLTNDPAEDRTPDWSPDGKHIVFHSNRAGNNEIYVMQANGSNPTNLTNQPGNDTWASWSPDSTRITFTTYRHGSAEIYTMKADGSNQTRVTFNVADDTGSNWRP